MISDIPARHVERYRAVAPDPAIVDARTQLAALEDELREAGAEAAKVEGALLDAKLAGASTAKLAADLSSKRDRMSTARRLAEMQGAVVEDLETAAVRRQHAAELEVLDARLAGIRAEYQVAVDRMQPVVEQLYRDFDAMSELRKAEYEAIMERARLTGTPADVIGDRQVPDKVEALRRGLVYRVGNTMSPRPIVVTLDTPQKFLAGLSLTKAS